MKEILELVAEGDMVLGVGHQSTRERLMVVREAVKLGVKRIEITHVNYPLAWLTPDQSRIFSNLGTYIGIYALDINNPHYYTWDDVMAIYKAVGPEKLYWVPIAGILISLILWMAYEGLFLVSW